MRVAHVGNVANNAFIAMRLHRNMGVESYCLSPDFEHVMGFPFWEDSSKLVTETNHWQGSKIQAVETPVEDDWRYFWSGDWATITDHARRFGDDRLSSDIVANAKHVTKGPREIASRGLHRLYLNSPSAFQSFFANYIRWYATSRVAGRSFHALDEFFDAYIFYGPYVAFADLTRRPYVAFEHGTLREWAQGSTPRQKRTLEGFRNAKHVLISNHDALSADLPRKVGLDSVTFSAHPITDQGLLAVRGRRRSFEASVPNEPTVLCPARHTWGQSRQGAKGTELLVEAIIELSSAFPNLRFQLVRWGPDVRLSEKALSHRGVANNVTWLPTMTRPLLRELMADSFCVIDQFKAPAFGGIGTDALAIGIPLLTRSDKKAEARIFGSESPALDVFDVASCVEQFTKLYLSSKALQVFDVGWFDRHLSQAVFEAALARVTPLLESGL